MKTSKFVRNLIIIDSDTDFHDESKSPQSEVAVAGRLPYIQFIKSWICFGFEKRYFSSLFRHRRRDPQDEVSKNEERTKKHPTKDSSEEIFEILLFLFSSSFPSFLCLLVTFFSYTKRFEANAQTRIGPKKITQSYSYLGCEYFMFVAGRIDEQGGTHFENGSLLS